MAEQTVVYEAGDSRTTIYCFTCGTLVLDKTEFINHERHYFTPAYFVKEVWSK